MVKRRTFKKSVKAAVSRAISKYQRRKMSYVMTINMANGNYTIDGQQQNAFSIGEILSGNTSEFQTIGKQYAMVKLRGILIEAVPALYTSGYNIGLCLGQANDSVVFNNVKTQPNVMLLNIYGKSKMYVPISGEFTSTNSIELFTNMKLIPFSSSDTNCYFTVRVTLYLTFKSNL